MLTPIGELGTHIDLQTGKIAETLSELGVMELSQRDTTWALTQADTLYILRWTLYSLGLLCWLFSWDICSINSYISRFFASHYDKQQENDAPFSKPAKGLIRIWHNDSAT